MPYNRYKSRSKRWKKRARGKYSRRGRNQSFTARVRKAMNKITETKMHQIGHENKQLYHDVGAGSGPTTKQYPIEWNPWSGISLGTGVNQRIGEKINPRMMVVRLWLANKSDRPNLLYRVIVARIPKAIAGVLSTANNIDLFRADHIGSNGNTICGMINTESGIRCYYDRVVNMEGKPGVKYNNLGAAFAAETHCFRKLVIKSKKKSNIVYDGNVVVNNPIGIWVIPYDSYGTLQTDNIASCAATIRLYYKDV